MNEAGFGWLAYALMTVSCWGLYGIFLHGGQIGMADPVNGRYKAYLLVGVAYFLVAVLAPLAILLVSGSDWNMPLKGMTWSLVAGHSRGVRSLWRPPCFRSEGHSGSCHVNRFRGCPDRERDRLDGSPSSCWRHRRNPLAVFRRNRARRARRLPRDAVQAQSRASTACHVATSDAYRTVGGGPLTALPSGRRPRTVKLSRSRRS